MENANAQWRRPANAPILGPALYTQMMATKCESQIGADWMCVRAHQHIPHGGGLDEQVSQLLEGMHWVWEAYNKDIAAINGCEQHINGNFRLLLQDNNLDDRDPARTIING
eukprot:5140592-Karenia_brevis.AAC.1